MPKVGVADTNVDHLEVAFVIVDLGTRQGELYAPADEVLPSADAAGGAATKVERWERPAGAGDRPGGDRFERSRERFEVIVGWLDGEEAGGLEHSELELRIETHGRELLRALFQDHLDLRAERELRAERVADVRCVERRAVEADHQRPLQSVFGEVQVKRLAYRARGEQNLYPADGVLNLPDEHASHGVRRLAAVESSRGSFDEATSQVRARTGLTLGKRQVEQLAVRAAADFESFYATSARSPGDEDNDDVLVLSADGKGIRMRPDALRPATAKAAQETSPKLKTRLSRGEKTNRKRIAEVGAVYEIKPAPRTPEDVLASTEQKVMPAPKAKRKWLTASVLEDAKAVVADVFDEAERRDPTHQRTWVALVDGNNHQIDQIKKKPRRATPSSPFSSTWFMFWNICGARPGASSTRATPPPRPGCTRKRSPCCKVKLASLPPRSAAKPPVSDSTPTRAARPTAPPTTCTTSAPTSTIPPRWRMVGQSRPA